MLYNAAVSMVRGKRNATKRKIGNNTTAEIMSDGTEYYDGYVLLQV